MTVSAPNDVHYDPYDVELNADPYPMFKRIREEAPLYYNPTHDFYALSRFDDVNSAILDHETFSSARGAVLEIIKSGMEIPPGTLIFEDPPIHNIHRKLLSRMFTPRKIAALEPRIREFTARCLDPLVGTGRFDFVQDLGEQMPMRVIGMLLGIPEEDQRHVVDHGEATIRTERGGKMSGLATGEVFAEYIDYRAKHPSDDIMTELMNAEFEDETGTVRKLGREELLLYLTVIATAGSETTTRLIGWTGKLLSEHPDQRAELVADRSLLPQAIEEILRFEPPAPHMCRYVTRDVEYYGQTVPAGSAMMLLVGAANRDHRRFPPDGDVFDIHREPRQHLSFGVGAHFCLGNALARLEGRVALDEILNRFPEWEVDMSKAELSPTSTVRGWETMPATIP
ncbi:cytochrome P450 [Mycolicibacterium thermoresistibile]|uniref:Steroid C26-monooxygenase n=2 Tax=Mycolicibacterium thermoresistibile TaxID=1797 RepID=G7CL66_MYCT3|nr:cytochrome P450 [Mycolicibacterium thermoresistibile]EHI11873.1 cytochrome P450 [Mycolicibacterium thermoresistibile ATCC 19527]MCV7187912.1 cytochrome P450 [Mycolicibacterium thermoresistibile]GAT15280.1 cytochrome P450 [Mycolicibacterium thermoresistibile]SNW19247.1 cytochrome P450 [Mycolicibacterium thermoresistibile]